MRKVVTNNGADLILELLRQSELIRAGTDKKDNNKVQSNKTEYNHNPRPSLIGPDKDGKLLLSRKDKDINQRKKDEYFQETKNFIEDILSRMTEQDYKILYDAGFTVEDLTIESLASAVQIIKDYSVSKGKGNDKDLSEKSSGNLSNDELIKRMKDFDLPITKESMERIKGALKLSEEIPHMDKKDVLYLLRKDLPPTIENLYKARYSSQNNETIDKLSDADWKELTPRVIEIIDKTGAIADTDTLQEARWLIENDLPLTKSSLELLSDIDELIRTYDKDIILDRILAGMREGTLPGDVILVGKDKLSEQEVHSKNENSHNFNGEKIKKLMESIHENYDDEIIKAVKADQKLTIKNLESLREEAIKDEEQSLDKLTKDQRAKVIKAKRQLEEIRLKMTAEAAQRLEKRGFSIDTRPLEEVVEKLRNEEEIYYKELYHQAGIVPDEEEIDTLRTTVESVHILKTMPAYVLGTTLYDKSQHTVSGLISSGKSMLTELEKAKEAYETLQTTPRADYGDSIKKAFNNMDSLMEEMGIEDTVHNRRAIRILGYNQMEITKEAIEQVKAYDLRVNYLIQNLNPRIAVHIIKEGINPMDIPIDKLNHHIEKLNMEHYSPLEKYSTYLYKLEKESKISEAEKKAYIGIYRLLYQIEKSDGAALGAVLKSDREVTLNHLLTALRSIRKGGMDYKIDDDYGLLQDISFEKETITDQLGAVFNNQSVQEEIQKSIINQLLDSLTPNKLYQLHHKFKEDSPTMSKIWDTIGNMPIEKLLDEIRGIQTDSGEEDGYYYEKLKELRQIYTNCDQAIRFLNEFKLPCTTTNLIMAEYILNNEGSLFKNLKKHLKKTDDMSDIIIDRKTMNEAYDELENDIDDIIEEESKEDNIDSVKLNQLKSIGLQMRFIKTLAKREFYHIPIEISNKTTIVNLTIIRGKSDGGKVTVTLTSDRLGSIKAEASLKDNKLSGYFLCDYVDSLKLLQSQTELLKSLLKEENLDIKQLNFCLQQSPEVFRGYSRTWDSESNDNPESERILYRVAKAMLHMIKSAEETDIFSHREVAEIT